MTQVEAQNWWKDIAGPADVLTPERAQAFMHVHFRMNGPYLYPAPLGTVFTPTIQTILHNSFGHIQNVQSPLVQNPPPNSQFDRTVWPVPDANGEHELSDTRTYPDFTVPEVRQLMTHQAPFHDSRDPAFDRFVRLVIPIGSSGSFQNPKAAAWMAGLGQGIGARSYANLTASKLPAGFINAGWTQAVQAHGSGYPTNVSVLIDPNFHAHDPELVLGTVLYQAVNVPSNQKITIPITDGMIAALPDGVHRIAFIADDEGHVPGGPSVGVLGVVLQLWFTVQH